MEKALDCKIIVNKFDEEEVTEEDMAEIINAIINEKLTQNKNYVFTPLLLYKRNICKIRCS